MCVFFNKVKVGIDFCIKCCFIIGVSFVIMDDFISGFNIGINYFFLLEFNEMIGFMEKEVCEMLMYYFINSLFNYIVG